MEDEYGGGIRKQRKSGIRPFLPAIGLVLAVALAAVAYVLGPEAAKLADRYIGYGVTPELEWVFRGIVFIVLMALAVAILAATVPKPKVDKLATEQQLLKEKKQKQQEMLERKKRQRELHRKEAEARRKSAQK